MPPVWRSRNFPRLLAASGLVLLLAAGTAGPATASGPLHGPGSSHDPIVHHPVHGPGSSHNPIVTRDPVVRDHRGFPGEVRDHRTWRRSHHHYCDFGHHSHCGRSIVRDHRH